MHPSWISLTYTEILLFKTFMKLKLIVYTLPKNKIMKVNETGVGVAEWKNSTLKQKRNKESVKYVMKNIFQIVSTSSPTEIVVLNSLGSFSHFVTQNMSGQHRSPSEQNCSASHVHRCNKSTALSAAEHSQLFCSWVAVLFAETWEQRITDLFAQPWPPSTPYPCAGSGWHAPAPPPPKSLTQAAQRGAADPWSCGTEVGEQYCW